jgi:hypothetical protein
MRLLALLSVLSIGWPLAQSTPGQVLSNDGVATAITLGLRGSKLKPASCKAMLGHGGGFYVEAMGPMNRIQAAALEARSKYLGFTPANVSDSMRAMTLSVTAMPLAEIAMPGATHMVIKSKPPSGEPPLVLQPISYQVHPTGWGNRKSAGISAIFDLTAFKATPSKDVDVVTITAGGEARCKLSASVREKIE